MAVNKHKSLVRDFWNQYRKIAITSVILMQVFIGLLIALIMLLAGFDFLSFEYWLVVGATLAATTFCNIILVNDVILHPIRDLSAALTHVSGEPNSITPPKPTEQRFARSGLRPLLQLIYNLAANQPSAHQSTKVHHSKQGIVEKALSHSSASVVVLDENGTVITSTAHAPVKVDHELKNAKLDLLFDGKDTVEAWLAESQNSNVRSEKIWLRIGSKPLGDPDRRVFDVVASYEKNNPAPCTVVLLDKTSSYQPEDDQIEFLAFAAHELRGPVTVIRGYLDVLKDELGPSMSDDHLQLMQRLEVSANRLSSYVSNILNVSRYDQRHMKFVLSEQRPIDIYAHVAADLELLAKVQGRFIDVQLSEDLPTVAADVSSITEVFTNLIDNAIKYSTEGGTVTVRAVQDGDFVRVEVEDHGIGIPSSIISNLFHKFYRSHRSRETISGSGIGLYITKAIVESHGGSIDIKSSEGEGTIISFSLPIFSSIEQKLQANNYLNDDIVKSGKNGWIQNHAKIRS